MERGIQMTYLSDVNFRFLYDISMNLMDENFLQTTVSPDSGSLENSGNICSLSNMSVLPSMVVNKTNDGSKASEYQSFFHDDDFVFSRFSTMTRW